jgi:hypothetical protein
MNKSPGRVSNKMAGSVRLSAQPMTIVFGFCPWETKSPNSRLAVPKNLSLKVWKFKMRGSTILLFLTYLKIFNSLVPKIP